jgi:hypothetical protein
MAEPGADVMARFLGSENVESSRQYLEELDPELHRYIMDFVYGEVYAGDVLDPKTRALCTVAMLASLGQQLQLGVYVRASRATGRHRRGDPRSPAPGGRLRRLSQRLERAGHDEAIARRVLRYRRGRRI